MLLSPSSAGRSIRPIRNQAAGNGRDKEQLSGLLNSRERAQAKSGAGEILSDARGAQVTIARKRYRHAIAVGRGQRARRGPRISPEHLLYAGSGREGAQAGAALAQSFVSQHHGLIEYESEPGRTRFVILLPVRSPEANP